MDKDFILGLRQGCSGYSGVTLFGILKHMRTEYLRNHGQCGVQKPHEEVQRAALYERPDQLVDTCTWSVVLRPLLSFFLINGPKTTLFKADC